MKHRMLLENDKKGNHLGYELGSFMVNRHS